METNTEQAPGQRGETKRYWNTISKSDGFLPNTSPQGSHSNGEVEEKEL